MNRSLVLLFAFMFSSAGFGALFMTHHFVLAVLATVATCVLGMLIAACCLRPFGVKSTYVSEL